MKYLYLFILWFLYGSISCITSLIIDKYETTDIIYSMIVSRTIGSIIITPFTYICHPTNSIVINNYSLLLGLLPLFAITGWTSLTFLLEEENGAIANVLANLYIVLPIIILSCLKGLKWHFFKIVLILLSISSSVILAYPEENESFEINILYYITVIYISWTFVDVLCNYLPKELTSFDMTFNTTIGYLLMISVLGNYFNLITELNLYTIIFYSLNLTFPLIWIFMKQLSHCMDSSIILSVCSVNFIVSILFYTFVLQDSYNIQTWIGVITAIISTTLLTLLYGNTQ